jgi:DNA-binding IclR family transcriptional regulator
VAAGGAEAPTVEARLDAAIREHAQRGFCTSFGEWHPDINALGFTLRGPRGEHFAVSVGGPAYKLPQSMLLEKVAPRLVAVRETIEREAGHR